MKNCMEYTTNPAILQHPNIPKPLHGINPRSIFGQEWWDATRKEAYAKNNYHCFACGVHKSEAKDHQWLEAHEFWDIDYSTGICEVKDIVPLCHYCHNFIHSGRLLMIAGKSKTIKQIRAILEHGFQILKENNLAAFMPTVKVANLIKANTYNVRTYMPEGNAKWSDYKMLYKGEYYTSNFATYEDWQSHYQTK